MVKTLKNYYKLFEGDNLNFEKIFLNYPTKNDRRKKLNLTILKIHKANAELT